jgi:hypothetical protein
MIRFLSLAQHGCGSQHCNREGDHNIACIECDATMMHASELFCQLLPDIDQRM